MDSAQTRVWKIYKITCRSTGLSYIGQTVKSIRERWRGHIRAAIKADGQPKLMLHNAIQKYGEGDFEIEVIATTDTPALANELEQQMIATHGTLKPFGYNLALGGAGTPGVRRKHSEETKRKIAEGQKRRPPPTLETRARMSASRRKRKTTDETREKLRRAHKGRIFTEDTRAKIAASHRGRTFPMRSLSLLRGALKDDVKANRGVTRDGRKWSARVTINKQRVHIGMFDTMEEAAKAYREAIVQRILILEGELNASPAQK